MDRRKLIIALLASGALAGGYGAGVLPASAARFQVILDGKVINEVDTCVDLPVGAVCVPLPESTPTPTPDATESPASEPPSPAPTEQPASADPPPTPAGQDGGSTNGQTSGSDGSSSNGASGDQGSQGGSGSNAGDQGREGQPRDPSEPVPAGAPERQPKTGDGKGDTPSERRRNREEQQQQDQQQRDDKQQQREQQAD